MQNNSQNKTIRKLYIVATPIGNPKDITMRALDVLNHVDAIICEEHRVGSRFLNQHQINKELLTLNEHNEAQDARNIALRIAKGETMAIISDAGTPVFADPGRRLIELLYQMDVTVSTIPGPSSLVAALSLCDFPIDRFSFAGFPPSKNYLREGFLQNYREKKEPVILMDTPYRLTKLLTEVQSVFGKQTDILLACNLTQKKECVFRGQIQDILPKVAGQKHEFILILNRNQKRKPNEHG